MVRGGGGECSVMNKDWGLIDRKYQNISVEEWRCEREMAQEGWEDKQQSVDRSESRRMMYKCNEWRKQGDVWRVLTAVRRRLNNST